MMAFDLGKASTTGNAQILDAIIYDLDLDLQQLGDNFLVPILGD